MLKADLMAVGAKSDGSVGVLEVYIHQARDIHNICIYHNQDVYAKFCLTSNPDLTVSSRIINGGGRNPVFNDKLQLNVQQIDASLKCEIWMLSRAKDYLEDQLLGFALVPISAVAAANDGGLSQEFSLSSTDLFHSPAGFVQLSLSYRGYAPEVMMMGTSGSIPHSVVADESLPDSEANDPISSEYSKIEFPDLQIAKENERMVSEYFVMQQSHLDSECSDSFPNSSNENQIDSDIGSQVVDSVSSNPDSESIHDHPSPPSNLTNNAQTQEHASLLKGAEKVGEIVNGESKSPGGLPTTALVEPLIKINVPEQPVVQQHYVDMYMKSMQEFTESLAKMKLPMDIENGGESTPGPKADEGKKLEASKSTGSRVFYGSRAFF
ncbi:hypothetical protein EJ110_NYTH38273 [Nymphaea thermarum]|nr:hypothetical protein EJ110_NYTH38273 [Nymphaea thermarum]